MARIKKTMTEDVVKAAIDNFNRKQRKLPSVAKDEQFRQVLFLHIITCTNGSVMVG